MNITILLLTVRHKNIMKEKDSYDSQPKMPICGVLSLVAPLPGIAIAFFAASNAPPSSGDNWTGMITFVFYGVLSLVCGFLLAVFGLIRRERAGVISWLGLILNLIPILLLLGKAGILR